MDAKTDDKSAGKCPFVHTPASAGRTATGGRTSCDLQVLHQHSAQSDPMGEAFDYAKEFKSLDLQGA